MKEGGRAWCAIRTGKFHVATGAVRTAARAFGKFRLWKLSARTNGTRGWRVGGVMVIAVVWKEGNDTNQIKKVRIKAFEGL